MPAKSIRQVRDSLAKGPAAEAFAKGFAESHFAQALGVLPKAELDLFGIPPVD